jgi:NADPH-dependent 2,4-dienoyl-CoA reductase/sulfur reductase-like enzyme
VYNPEVGRERQWGAGTLARADQPRKVLVIGGGPAGLEYARVAAASGHDVTLHERAGVTGGHTRPYGALPHRTAYAGIGTWLTAQATKNGARIVTSSAIGEVNLDAILRQESPDHVVVATGARVRRDGFQGQTARPLPGHETGNCVGWDQVALGEVEPAGDVLVIDDIQDVAAPLVAHKLADGGAKVTLLTRWPMIAMDTVGDVYLHWMLTYVYQSGVEVITDHFVQEISGQQVTAFNIYDPGSTRELHADWIVMATGRASENALYHALRARNVSVEMIGDAVAPRGTYEATFEGHRQARKLSSLALA